MRLPILTYHAVLPVERGADVRGTVPLPVFREQMEWLEAKGYTSVTLDAAADWLEGRGALPPKPVVITFDDGYRCVLEHALDVLSECGFSGTLFVVTDKVGQTSDWYEAKGGPRFDHATWDELELARDIGHAVESHSVTHQRLGGMSVDERAHEIAVSRELIERRLGACRHFSYPYGEVPEDARIAVQDAGYRTAVTTREGLNPKGALLTALRRQNISRTTKPGRFRRRAGAWW